MYRHHEAAAAKPLHERIAAVATYATLAAIAVAVVLLGLAWTGVASVAALRGVWLPLSLVLTAGTAMLAVANGMKNARKPGPFRFSRATLIPVFAAAAAVEFATSHGLLPGIALLTAPAGAILLLGATLLADAAHDARKTGYTLHVLALSLAAIGMMLVGASGVSAASRIAGAGQMLVAALAMFGAAGLAAVVSTARTGNE